MSNQLLQAAISALCLAELGALVWALVPGGRRWGVLVANILSSAGLFVFLARELPSELATLATLEDPGFDDYKTTLLTVVEGVIVASATLALCGLRVPMALNWLGFAINAVLSAAAFFFAFFFEFHCCGYL